MAAPWPTRQWLLPIQSRMGIDVMSINPLWKRRGPRWWWRGPVIAEGAVKQF